MLKKLDIEKIKYIPKKIDVKSNFYVNLDDTFLNLKVNNKISKFRFRVILFHTGYEIKNKQKKIANKRVFYYLTKNNEKINTKKFTEEILRLAKKNYNNLENVKTIISGDGALWIKQVAKLWESSNYYVLDKFHVIRKIKYLINPKSEKFKWIYYELKELLEKGNYDKMMEILNNIKFKENNKIIQLNNLKKYLKNNKSGIINQNVKNNIGCSIENTISHNFKSLLGYGSKVFSKGVYNKIFNLHLSQVNNSNVISIIQELEMVKQKNNIFFMEQNKSLLKLAD